MAKSTTSKTKSKKALASNLFDKFELNPGNVLEDILVNAQDILDAIQNSHSLSPQNPHVEIPNGALNLTFLGSSVVSASSSFATWEKGGILKDEKKFKAKSLLVQFPVNRKFQTVVKIINTSSTGVFFIEREENNKRVLIKKINFNGKQSKFINFNAETTSKSDSQSFYVSFRENSEADSRYVAWEMNQCICTELI